ncbi:hypothetical protein [Roseitalea porphyridii]|uniref:Uncharacterized protein n=1 Tax=Roseitalea porphyridii TaxID=1852022 RepID=A0A4P6V5M2_9HYPH|nr:hypothetical protein [Roseitalea porphyridii]QBK32134.1 hypothetical protein E0E05_17015 [Roseitalea porphyridii]
MSAGITIPTFTCAMSLTGYKLVQRMGHCWIMEKSSSPLYPLLNEINTAAENGLPFLAVAMTVALPDICASLDSEDGRTNGERYKAWCQNNLPWDRLSFVTPDDLWSMRCGVLHNGRFGDMKHSVARVIFTLPDSGFTFTNSRMNDAYVYSVVDFCRVFTDAVYRWFEANQDDETVVANLPRLMQYREGGLSPYIVGATVLA